MSLNKETIDGLREVVDAGADDGIFIIRCPRVKAEEVEKILQAKGLLPNNPGSKDLLMVALARPEKGEGNHEQQG